METPTGRGAFSEGLWKTIALLLLCFMLCAAFLALPAGAKLTGEYAIRVRLEKTEEELRRLRAEHDRFLRAVADSIIDIHKAQAEQSQSIKLMSKDVQWQTKWLQAAGRK